MKAICIDKYGIENNIELREVEKPIPKENEVLVRVHAASVNFNTLIFATGKPLVGRLFTGLIIPKIKTPGNDISGTVEVIGENIKQFQLGDEVFGDISEYGFGAFAEYVAVPEKALHKKPGSITFEEAAALPEASLVALQALRDVAKIKPGQQVLIYGASGGIGTFAVQIAKYYGAVVTGVCGSSNLELVRSLGADHIIDYTKEDFTKSGKLYDIILATVGYRPIFDYKRALKKKGIYVVTGGYMTQIFQGMLLGPWLSMFGGKKLCSMTVKPNKDLYYMKELIESGKVKPVIDKIYSLTDCEKAMQHYSKGHAKGKVIINMI
jgi:NADPH:quinone reductase-like Zn-dependent oxidoreductase